jgi:outer membrane protein TolC
MKINLTVFALLFIVNSVLFAESDAESDRSLRRRPLTFRDAGEAAVAASKDLQSAQLQQLVEEKSWNWGVMQYLPSVSLSLSESDRVMYGASDSFQKAFSLKASQLVFDGGKLRTSRQIEKSTLLLQRGSHEQNKNEIAETAISVYRQVLQIRSGLDIKKKSYAALEKQMNILKTEVELGKALLYDLRSAEIKIQNSRIDIIQTEIDLKETEKQFAELLGMDELPPLAETIDMNKKFYLPRVDKVIAETLDKNQELAYARLSIKQKQAEAKYAAHSWIPTLKADSSFSVTGTRYPLSQFNWSVGLTLQFETPFLSSQITGGYGQEGRDGRNANVAGNSSFFQAPATVYNARVAKSAYELECIKYEASIKQLERSVVQTVEKIKLIIQKKDLAVSTEELALRQMHISELQHSLGQITRIELMELETEYMQSRLATVAAAVEVLTAVRELEKLMALNPGELESL